jgi:uncharacterized protein YbcI
MVETPESPHGRKAADISNMVVQLMRDYTGRGPTKARTTINGEFVAVVMKDTMLRAEKRLVDAGKQDTVLRMRRSFQEAMGDDLSSGVEQIMGRKVVAFMSDNHVDPDLAVELFVLDSASPDSPANQG